MGMSDQINALAALTPANVPSLPVGEEAGWATEQV
jgi:hypothetical protein